MLGLRPGEKITYEEAVERIAKRAVEGLLD